MLISVRLALVLLLLMFIFLLAPGFSDFAAVSYAQIDIVVNSHNLRICFGFRVVV